MIKYKDIPGEVQWFVNDNCNYQCSYCFVDHNDARAIRVKNYKKFLKSFKDHIPSEWNFLLIGGGEPFIHPDFYNIVKGLVDLEYTISVNTNFSSSTRDLKKFFKITEGKLVYFIASLHLERSTPNNFISKILAIRSIFPEFKNLYVDTVAIPGKLKIYKNIHKQFSRHEIILRLQPFRQKDHGRYQYSSREQKIIDGVNKPPKLKININRISDTFGRKCSCGYKYLIVNPSGRAYRCIPAMRSKRDMGNILDNKFKLFSLPKKCREQSCFCLEKYRPFFKQQI